jgi:Ice-binding-like
MLKPRCFSLRRFIALLAIASITACTSGNGSNTPQLASNKPAITTVLSCDQNAITGQGVPLGSDDSFAVLAAATVTNSGPTLISGNLGVSPGTAVTGFGAGTGTVTNGAIHAADPTAAQAQVDLTAAYNNAAGRANPVAVAADIGGMVITPGLYKAPVSLAITGNVTLDGQNDPNSVFIFQAASTLITAVNSSVTLINGASACNVFWQVGSSATLNTSSLFNGNILAQASISLGTGATVNGRLLARAGAITLLSNTVTAPITTSTPTPSPSVIPTAIPTALSCDQNAITGQGVPLGSDNSFAVLAAATVTNSGPTLISGNLGVSPGTAVTGFGAGTGTVTNGAIHAADPTAAQAQVDLTAAYNNAAGRANPVAVPADIGGIVITPGLYQAPVSLAITGNVTLDGQNNPNSVFIFQAASTLVTAVGSSVTLINGANACNVFWQVGSSATLNTSSLFNGNILAQASISLGTGAMVNGRLLARAGAVTLLSNTVTAPAP